MITLKYDPKRYMMNLRRLKRMLLRKLAKSPMGWVFFLLASPQISGKKPHPPGAFPEV